MNGWRFYPLRDHPRTGLLVSPERNPSPAMFLTPAQAKDRQERQTLGAAQ
jgi:hypothetical protein